MARMYLNVPTDETEKYQMVFEYGPNYKVVVEFDGIDIKKLFARKLTNYEIKIMCDNKDVIENFEERLRAIGWAYTASHFDLIAVLNEIDKEEEEQFERQYGMIPNFCKTNEYIKLKWMVRRTETEDLFQKGNVIFIANGQELKPKTLPISIIMQVYEKYDKDKKITITKTGRGFKAKWEVTVS